MSLLLLILLFPAPELEKIDRGTTFHSPTFGECELLKEDPTAKGWWKIRHVNPEENRLSPGYVHESYIREHLHYKFGQLIP